MFVKFNLGKGEPTDVAVNIHKIDRITSVNGKTRVFTGGEEDSFMVVDGSVSNVLDLISRSLYDHEKSMAEAREAVRW